MTLMSSSNVGEILERVLQEEAAAIVALSKSLDSRFCVAVDWILNSRGRVIACGIGKSGHIANKAAGTLSSTGTPSLFLHAAEAVHGDLGMVTQSDIVLMYSFSGETDELVQLFPAIHEIGARVVLITGREDSSAARLADLVLPVPIEREACPNNLAPTTSTTLMLAVSDAIAVAIMECRGFTSDDFAKFHPSGTLGRRLLLRVRDVMRSGDDISIVQESTPIIDVMRSITQAGAGAACVVDTGGELIGLISDGDIRRHFLNSATPLDAIAGGLMTKNVTTIPASLLAIEGLEVFQTLPKRIGEIPVIDGGKLVGILMLKDLTRSGII